MVEAETKERVTDRESEEMKDGSKERPIGEGEGEGEDAS